MKGRALVTAVVLVGFVVCVFSSSLVNVASAESGKNFIVSAVSNSAWILNKVSRKLMFIQYQKEDEVWKSHPVTVPANMDLDNCALQATGGRGSCVFLYDTASGIITFYEVKKDHSVKEYMIVDTKADLK
jgi:hypothetical protein